MSTPAWKTRIVDERPCAWCTNPFGRTRDQVRRNVRHCCRRCTGFGRALTISDEGWAALARRAHKVRAERRTARLAAIVANLSAAQAYVKGYQSGFAAGKHRRKPLIDLSARVAS